MKINIKLMLSYICYFFFFLTHYRHLALQSSTRNWNFPSELCFTGCGRHPWRRFFLSGGWVSPGSGLIWQGAHPRVLPDGGETGVSEESRVPPWSCSDQIYGCRRTLCLDDQHCQILRGGPVHLERTLVDISGTGPKKNSLRKKT